MKLAAYPAFLILPSLLAFCVSATEFGSGISLQDVLIPSAQLSILRSLRIDESNDAQWTTPLSTEMDTETSQSKFVILKKYDDLASSERSQLLFKSLFPYSSLGLKQNQLGQSIQRQILKLCRQLRRCGNISAGMLAQLK